MAEQRSAVGRRSGRRLSIARGFTHKIRERFAHNLNSCHVWREDGATIAAIKNGEEMEPPLWIVDRLEKLGLDPGSWQSRMRGE